MECNTAQQRHQQPAAWSGAERENGVSIKSPIPIYCDGLQNRTSSYLATLFFIKLSFLIFSSNVPINLMRMWNRMKICQNPIIDVSLVSSIKHQHSTCIFTSLHRHYNLIFPEITSLLNKTDLCFNRSPLCQLELQGER